jgi:uncharacterized protein (TIGR00725 family)
MKKKRNFIAVIGGSQTDEGNLRIAEEVGCLIARGDDVLITGGLGGVMQAASKGAKSCGGLVIGILPATTKDSVNPYVDIPIVTGMGEARNTIIARTCDGAIAIDGAYGTLSEIAFCLQFGVVVVGINTWDIEAPILKAANAQEAVTMLMKALE